MLKTLPLTTCALACCAATNLAQAPQAQKPSNAALLNLTATTRPVDSRAAENLLAAYDGGDSFAAPKGRRTLLRLTGAIAVQLSEGQTLAALTAKGGVLEGYERGFETRNGFAWLKSGALEREQQIQNKALLAARIGSLGRTPGVRSANPVFIEPESGLWAMTTDEVIVALKPGFEARDYFGADWPRVKPLFPKGGQYILTLDSAASDAVFAEVTRRAADPRVAWAEPNFISQGLTQLLPNDPRFNEQWPLRNTGQSGGTAGADVKAAGAWDRTTGSRSVVVAVLDTGVDLNHPDLISNVFTNTAEIPGNNIDDDNNGFADDVRGWDFLSGDNNPNPNTAFDNHGTAVAGAVVAAGNNGVGIAGMAYSCRFMSLRIGESTTAGSFGSRDSDIANALYYAAGGFNPSDSWRGADVIVMSFESFQAAVVDTALTYATEQGRAGLGCPTFVAMGNHGDGWRTAQLNNFPNGTFTFAWQYRKDGSVVGGEDAIWMAQVNFPGGAVERFDGATFPPAGWTTSGDANWTRATDPAHALGPTLFTARSGVIGNSQSTTLQTMRTVTAGNLTFLCWVSCDNSDTFSLSVNGQEQSSINQSGAPFIRSGPSYPGTHTNVITVGASGGFDTRSAFSQIGGKLDVLAPGGDLVGGLFLTTDRTGAAGDNPAASPDGDYENAAGTSLANPLAAGVGALMLSVTPNLTAKQVRDILRLTADKVGPVPYTNGWNPYYGAGRVNASNAVALASAPSCLGVPLIVTNLADSGPGTLRDAITRINASVCPGVISLVVPGAIQLVSSLPAISTGATILGPGTNQLTISGNGNSVFNFAAGTLNKIAGIRIVSASSTSPGASVANYGRTVIENCVVANSFTLQSMGGAAANMTASAELFVTNTVFVGNAVRGGNGESRSENSTSGGGGGGGAGLGGAIYSEGATLVLHNCAFIGNTATGGNGGNGGGNVAGDSRGGDGGLPNRGNGGSGFNAPGGGGGFGGGAGGGGRLAAGGTGGFGGGGGGGGASVSGGTGGAGGVGGQHGAAGGTAQFSFAGGGGGGAGLGGALFVNGGFVTLVNCEFTGNLATNGLGGNGSFGAGNGQAGQGVGGAIFNFHGLICPEGSSFTGNSAATSYADFNSDVPTLRTFYSFDSFSAADALGNSVSVYHGDGGTWFNVDHRGQNSSAVALNDVVGGQHFGTNNYYEIATPAVPNYPTLGLGLKGDFTVSAWIFPRVLGGWKVVLGNTGPGVPGSLVLGLHDNNAYFAFWNNDIAGSKVIQAGQWTHMAWTYNAHGGQMAIYVNGQLDVSAVGRPNTTKDAGVLLGFSEALAGSYFQGFIDEFAIYCEALSASQIAALAAPGGPLPTVALPPPVLTPALPTVAACDWSVREIWAYTANPPQFPHDLPSAAYIASTPQFGSFSNYASLVINRYDPETDPPGDILFAGNTPFALNNRTPDGLINGDDNQFVLAARCTLQIAQEDDYTFGFASDDGASLRVKGAVFTSSTRLNPDNPANPAHRVDTLSFPADTGDSRTLGVAHLRAGAYEVEFITWEDGGGANAEVFLARGAHTTVDSNFRLLSPQMFLPAPRLAIQRTSPTQVRLTWSPDTGCLQSAPAVQGPWKEVSGVSNGGLYTIDSAQRYFRIVQ